MEVYTTEVWRAMGVLLVYLGLAAYAGSCRGSVSRARSGVLMSIWAVTRASTQERRFRALAPLRARAGGED